MTAPSDRWAQYRAEVEAHIDCAQVFSDIKQAQPSGNGHMVGLCPFHDDHHPSLGFDPKSGAWECFSGCGKGSVFDFVARQIGTDFKGALVSLGRDLGLEPPSSNGDRPAQVEYSYCDETGTELFQVVRTTGKRFWQRRPDGQGNYVKGIKDVRRVLYRLPELLAQPDTRVFIVEGEKDVERLRRSGLVATTSPGGAGKWKQEYSRSLEGRDVVVLPDNDDPGRAHSQQVAQSLQGIAESVRIVEIPGLPDKGDVSDWLNAGHTVEELHALIARETTVQQAERRPRIQIKDRQLSDVVSDTWRVLLQHNDPPSLFVSSGQLARLQASSGDPRIQLFDDSIAYGHLIRQADWLAITDHGIQNKKPPLEVSRDIQANPHPALPQLEAVITTPVFDRSGRLLVEPGYHPDARLWLHLDPGAMPDRIPSDPTKQDLENAVTLLCSDLLVDFPFAADSDLAHAVGAFILPFVRRMIDGPVPIHLVEAPTPGSGKSLLADLVAIVTLGHPSESTTATKNEDESRKKLTAILSRGQPLVVIDNVNGGLDSAQLSAAITAETWSDRLLGKSQMVEFPNRALWMVTGNNPKLSLEIARRCVRIRMEPREERPWERTGFKHNPIRTWAKEHRQELVKAILIIIQAWIQAGRPVGTKILGSFECWAQVTGGILRNAGFTEFLQDTDEFYAEADSDSGEWHAFVQAWWDERTDEPVTTRDLLRLAQENDLVGFAYAAKSERAELIRFGRALSGIRGRKLGDFQVTSAKDSHTKSNCYRLVSMTKDLFEAKEPF
ncbi:MAG: CHC2 zinc finger domain-containing protein [Thermoanaerobaculales bacterium]|jgi:hypothetical protein|nr:CHC2 zinc finger domain-containing protein [Thermoanaerobaculales bacterium]